MAWTAAEFLGPERLHELIAVGAAVLVALFSASAITRAWRERSILGGSGYTQINDNDNEDYEDADGVATQDSIRAFSDTRPRIAVGLAIFTGVGALVASNILIPPALSDLVFWAEVACWSLLTLQAILLPAKHFYSSRFRSTVYGLLSSLVIAVGVVVLHGLQGLTLISDSDSDTKQRAVGILYLVQFLASVGAVFGFAAFPRRPDVYDEQGLVDQQHTRSLLDLFSFSWNRVIFDVAKERQMKLEDIPNLDFATKSRNLQARYIKARREKLPLWKQLIYAYSRELALQWLLTLVVALLALFPQVVLYNFLERIESSQKQAATDPTIFIWVLALLLAQLFQVGVNNWIRWITTTRLEIPVGSLLQSLVFFKALRQYETAPPGQKEDKKDKKDGKDGEPNGVKDTDSKPGKKPNAKGKEPETRQNIINHMKLDSNRVTIFCMYNNNFPMAIFKLIFAGGFCISLMGWLPVVSGLLTACLVIPISSRLSTKYTALHFGLMKYRDGKAHLLTEALQGMRQIRFSALEQHWEDKILKSRNEELKQYWRVCVWQCLVVFIINLGPMMLASVTYGIYVWQNGTNIKASVLFTALGLFDQLDEAVALLPLLQTYLLEAWTSAVRLEKFFGQSDKEPVSKPGDSILFKGATVAWPRIEDTEKPDEGDITDERGAHSMLRDINLEFPVGQLTLVSGKTGAGKSLLLAAILGEVKLLKGCIQMPTLPKFDHEANAIPESEWIIPQLTAFVSQTPWIEGGTVRENVIFGLPFVEDRYRKVLAACALEKDIELLIDGDETEVGPKGVTLSGGQRWRTALARALYSRAGILVLDDVLSAVDAHVGRLIVDKALTGELARGRTRIIATHHAELVMPHASFHVQLHNGEVLSVEHLTPSEDSLAFATPSEEDASSTDDSAVNTQPSMVTKKKSKDDEESRETGRVKTKVYKAYFKASGGLLPWIGGVCILLLGHFMSVFRAWSLKELAQAASTEPEALRFTVQTTSRNDFHFVAGSASEEHLGWHWGYGIYFWLSVWLFVDFSILLVQIMRVLTFFLIGMKASRALFQNMTHAILRAPLRWIDTVPAGRILNRFTSDMFIVDRRLSNQAFTLIRTVLFLLVIIATSLSVSVYVIFFGILLFILYVRVSMAYIDAAREVKRINSVSHSPIYDQFSSVLSGLSTIRAFDRTEFYMNRMFSLIDNSSKASWALQLSGRWMAVRMGVLGALFVAVVANAVAVSGTNAALAGFSLAFALRYTNALTSVLQALTSVELGFNACERVLEYAEIETEPEGGKDVAAAWPTEGKIEVQNLTVKYADDLPPVLKQLNFNVGAGERVGIVGRTGAGKSTLAAVFFRLLVPVEGSVYIDNVDISTLKLSQLRSRLAIIPQDPFLFSGTLRSNLDMEGLLEDHELISALQRVHLIEPVDDQDRPAVVPRAGASVTLGSSAVPLVDSETATEASTMVEGEPTVIEPEPELNQPGDNVNIFTNLSTPISTGGANLSQGQRQLVCLARSLLKRPKIVILDEATSAVDKGTDGNIQESLRKEFAAAGCTVLVIAHRLSTVADFDRLLVMDKGRVAEFGSPRELLEAGMRRSVEKPQQQDVSQVDGVTGEEDNDDDNVDGTGAFWELVQKSAEKEKLLEMVFGSGKDILLKEIFGTTKGDE
ncbi:hypothetical protein QBC40DRAFT_267351 [Triangularia verruculosa]|uniref:Uncharacterized protein n=1 Tax=Triangularia verruculosa TaxID=2587418 RepID=A0AAN6XCT8_9PEZI|nr:hypothetical protein QBC40DRAFT_267351 [Triangularia verruculosa]